MDIGYNFAIKSQNTYVVSESIRRGEEQGRIIESLITAFLKYKQGELSYYSAMQTQSILLSLKTRIIAEVNKGLTFNQHILRYCDSRAGTSKQNYFDATRESFEASSAKLRAILTSISTF